MKMLKVTVTYSIWIAAKPEVVWDYTQDWSRRHEWDPSVISAHVRPSDEADAKPLTVQVEGRSGFRFTATYKLSDRPRLTTLVMSEVRSIWSAISPSGGGGSWKYEAEKDGTRWTQNNTLTFYDTPATRWLHAFYTLALRTTTRRMMNAAKRRIESGSASGI